MNEETFEEIAARITQIYRNHGEPAAFAERDRLNRELEESNLYLSFQGEVGGTYLAFSLFDSSTQPHRVVYKSVRQWVLLLDLTTSGDE